MIVTRHNWLATIYTFVYVYCGIGSPWRPESLKEGREAMEKVRRQHIQKHLVIGSEKGRWQSSMYVRIKGWKEF